MMILIYLLLCSPLITHLVIDFRGTVIHWLNFTYVLAMAVSIGFILGWEGAVYSVCIHFSLFDPIYNLMHGHAWDYHGDPRYPEQQAFTDKQWEKIPWYGEIMVRLFVLAVGIGVFHYSHLL